MLSLTPRYDLFRFSFPKDFLPEAVEKKYSSIINKNPGVLYTPIDYLNESIQGVNFPGISDILVQQTQHGSNSIIRKHGRINVEPNHNMIYQTPANPLDKIEMSFKVTFRMNHGLYNYFMIYETIFHQLCKPNEHGHQPLYKIELMNEDGTVNSIITFQDVLIDGIDGLDFNYNKIERDSGTFDVTFKFANIDFEIL